jgi:hypothetical protein
LLNYRLLNASFLRASDLSGGLMTLKNLLRVHGILALIYGIGLISVPVFFLALLSASELSPLGTDIARVLGAALVMLAVVAWQSAGFEDVAQRQVAFGLWLYALLGLIVTVIGQLQGNWNMLNWLTVVLFVIWLAAYSFFLFVRR